MLVTQQLSKSARLAWHHISVWGWGVGWGWGWMGLEGGDWGHWQTDWTKRHSTAVSQVVQSLICKHLRSGRSPKKTSKEPESEPVYKFYDWYEADSEAKPADAAQTWDEVQPGHPLRPLKFWRKKIVYNILNCIWYIWRLLTKDSWTPKENVHHSYVLLIGVVIILTLYLVFIIAWHQAFWITRPGWEKPTALSLGYWGTSVSRVLAVCSCSRWWSFHRLSWWSAPTLPGMMQKGCRKDSGWDFLSHTTWGSIIPKEYRTQKTWTPRR